jgi:SAM-dependent methyltransferase
MAAGDAKQQQHDTWRAVAAGWARRSERLRRLGQPVTERFLREIAPGQRVLDVASGVGEPALTIAEHVGRSGRVVGTDLVEEMVAAARATAAARGVVNVEFRHVDGEALDVDPGTFDVVTSRWGLMFMPDPVACLTAARRALGPGGRLVAAVWASPDRNPWIAVPMGVLMRGLGIEPPPPGTPGAFALADWERLQGVVEAAGFTSVLLEELALPMSDCDRGHEYLEFMLDLAGPLTALFDKVPEAERAQAMDEMAAACEAAGGGTARLPGVTWIVTAAA